MKKFKVTMLVPNERVIEAGDIQAAHALVNKMIHNALIEDNVPRPIVHSIIEVVEAVIIDFGPSPAA